MSFDLTNKNIQDTFQNLLQRTGSDNRLYDLTGNEIGDLRISGSLIAQQYVVSSSVTNITTQQLSGSTQFGDSLDDTHQFTGSLNVTGSITKGNIPFVLSNQTGSFVTNIDSPSQGNIRKTDAVTGVGSNISLGLRTTDNVKFNHITASGNISASGTIIGSNISGTNTGDQDLSGLALKTEVSGAFTSDSASFSTRISVNEVVTAKTLVSSSAQIASDISGSSTTLSSSLSTRVAANEVITARTLVSSSTQIADDISGSFTSTSSSLSTRLATAESELNNTLISSSLQFDSSDNVTFNNITASGNISSSGNISATGNLDIDGTSNFADDITIAENKKIIFDSADTFIRSNTGNPEDLVISADEDIILAPDDNIQIEHGATTYAEFMGDERKFSITGEISASSTASFEYAKIGKSLIVGQSSLNGYGTVNANINDLIVNGQFSAAGSAGSAIYKLQIGDNLGMPTDEGDLNVGGELLVGASITASGDISSSGAIITEQIYVGSNIFHNGDTNTNITFGTDTITFKAGNEAFITITEDGSQDNIVIGDGGDIDFHVKAGGDNTLFAQGSSQRIGIGTATPTSKLQVSGDITTTHITASGNISASGDILTSGDFLNSQTIQMTNSSSVINTFNTGSHQTCKYVLQVTSGSFIQSSEMLVVQSGSNAFNTEYAQIGTAVNLGSFSTSVSGNVVKLSFAGDFISCSVKFNRTLI